MLRVSSERCLRHLLRGCNAQWCCCARPKHVEAVATERSVTHNEGHAVAASTATVRPPFWFATPQEVCEIPIFTRHGDAGNVPSVQQTDSFGLVSLASGSRGALSSLFPEGTTSAVGGVRRGFTQLGLDEEAPEESLVQAYLDNVEGDYDALDIADRLDAKLHRFIPTAAADVDGRPLLTEPLAAEIVATHVGCRGTRRLDSYRWKHLAQVEDGYLLWKDVRSAALEMGSPRGRSVCSIPIVDADESAAEAAAVAERGARMAAESTTVVDRPSEGRPQVNTRRFDPLEVRAQVASIRRLHEMTVAKDVEGLRATLNEYRWPEFDAVRHFVADLFDVFVEKAADADEVKLLMYDFAATDCLVYVRDRVLLGLLERIVREQGLLTANAYARHHRELFLVKPPMESDGSWRMRAARDRLLATIFASDADVDLTDARAFVDTLVQLQYIDEQDAFLCAIVQTRLSKEGFDSALKEWIRGVHEYRSTAGSHILMRFALTDSRSSASLQGKRLKSILTHCEQLGHPYDGLAELIVELLKAGFVEDAELLFLKLAVCGKHFDAPLERLKGDAANIVYVEELANLITKCVFAEQKRGAKNRKKGAASGNAPDGQVETCEDPEVAKPSRLDFLLKRWKAPKKKKFVPLNQKMKKYKVDTRQLQELVRSVQTAWIEIAEIVSDTASLGRLSSWCQSNRIDLPTELRRKCEKIYSAKNEKSPFEDKDA